MSNELLRIHDENNNCDLVAVANPMGNFHMSTYAEMQDGTQKPVDGWYLFSKMIEKLGQGGGATNLNVKNGDGEYSIAEGNATTAYGECSHAEGFGTTASGNRSHAEGEATTASGSYSHAEGYETTASGYYSHAEGNGTTASYDCSHAEGEGTTASGGYSHAEGSYTTASGRYSHAEGVGTTAKGNNSHVEGKWNITDTNTFAHIIGNGTDDDNRHNCFMVGWDGAIYVQASDDASKMMKITVASNGTITATQV